MVSTSRRRRAWKKLIKSSMRVKFGSIVNFFGHLFFRRFVSLEGKCLLIGVVDSIVWMDLENGWDIRYHQWRWIEKLLRIWLKTSRFRSLFVIECCRDCMSISVGFVLCNFWKPKKINKKNEKTLLFSSCINCEQCRDLWSEIYWNFTRIRATTCAKVGLEIHKKFYDTARVDDINVSWIGATSFQGYSAVFHISIAQLFNTHTSLWLEQVEKWNTEISEISSFFGNSHQNESHLHFFWCSFKTTNGNKIQFSKLLLSLRRSSINQKTIKTASLPKSLKSIHWQSENKSKNGRIFKLSIRCVISGHLQEFHEN